MHPVEERHVELGERVVVDDVFRDPAKQPQPRQADEEPDGEVEPQVLRACKPGGHERPGTRIAYPELLEPRCREDALPDELGTLDRSEEHTSELQSQSNLVCRLLLEKKKKNKITIQHCLTHIRTYNLH